MLVWGVWVLGVAAIAAGVRFIGTPRNEGGR